MRILMGAASLAGAMALAGAAHADPCEAPVRDFTAGDSFSGVVRYVGDGDSLCVGRTTDPADWIEVRLGDFDAPEVASPQGEYAKSLLEAVAMGRSVQCVAGGSRGGRVVSYDRVVAICRVGGSTLGAQLKARGAPQGGR